MTWIILVSCIGFVCLLKNLTSLVRWILNLLLRPAKDLTSYGSWALVTGSTDGIGKAFAFKLAALGLNLVLLSRNSAKLKTVSAQIQASFPHIKIKVFELDFSSGDVGPAQLKEAVKGLDIGVLINNVGVTYPRPMYFHEVDDQVWMNLVRVNLQGTTHVTRAVIAGMIHRGRGAILNIGSGASVVVPSHPLYAIYAATKAYVDQLSRSLYVEYKHYGIDIQCQVPLYVSTRMASEVAYVEKSTIFIPTAERYVEAAVKWIGYESRCSPYWAHSLQWFFASMLPHSLLHSWRLSVAITRTQKKPTSP
ncbi:very-long-chain 3-oxoacyl-CoA reductase-like protein At1g24470 [Salvia miltiorrhiza]|uniref:very-long-chain 3-oxoacyl-CoA reductase-like protein At1g24470 n=1 Tax=Salvia miltiorrhiza TaxID=226208 RepID=UPI0025AB6CD9|nr:very-long-chain 3-oxoacyl-CoA reductase-like protein At1g24470 [Salvia miltiorrhiza]